MQRWAGLLDRFAATTVTVIGESCLDGWYAGPSRRLSREAPVPVVAVDDIVLCPGGAANAAVGVAALGGRVRFVSAVGDDDDGAELLRVLAAGGVATDGVLVVPGRRTVAKRRVLSDAQLLVRFDTGDTGGLDGDREDELLRRVRVAVEGADVVLAADYDGGLLTDRVREAVGRECARTGALLVVDAHRPARWAPMRPYAAKPDAEEVAALLGEAGRVAFARDRQAAVREHAEQLLSATGAQVLAVTLDREGALVLQAQAPPARLGTDPAPVAHTVGAGDSFSAAFSVALAAGAGPVEAAEAGCAAAGVVVRQPGTTACRLAQLRDRLSAARSPVLPVEHLAACTANHRALGRQVVMTNGCFDGLHRGHVAHLEAAKACGDVLVVALNSDESTRQVKGSPPVHPVEDRVAVLAGLSSVDHVVVFDGDTPADLLRLARPDVWVKGGDYTEQMLREAELAHELGADVRILDWVDLPDAAVLP